MIEKAVCSIILQCLEEKGCLNLFREEKVGKFVIVRWTIM